MPLSPSQHHFDSIVGHDVIKRYLLSARETAALPHAFLFHGPEGIGKTSTAYALAKLLSCERGSTGACTCDACRKISDGVYADIMTVQPKGAAGQITLAGWKPGKDDGDGPQYYRFIDTLPMEGQRKILIFGRADRMNVALSNYLLKLIEEPPSYLTIVLVTHRPGDLLVTIRSRCTPLKFMPLVENEMREYARKYCADAAPGELDAAIRIAEGRPVRLEELLTNSASTVRSEVGELMRRFQQHGFISLFRIASDLLAAGAKGADAYEQALDAMQAWLRDALIWKSAGAEQARKLIVNAGAAEEIAQYAQAVSTEKLIAAVDLVRSSYEYVPRMTDKNYVLENLLLKIGREMRA